jgi:hypothetical protein
VRWLAILVLSLAAGASAQDVGVAWQLEGDWRLADANARWIALERDECNDDGCAQVLRVVRVETGEVVLTTPGWERRIWTDISSWFSLAIRPWLFGDRLVTLRDGGVLVAVSLPDGAEVWRATVPEGIWDFGVSPVIASGDTLIWRMTTGSRVIDGESGDERFVLPPGEPAFAGDTIVVYDGQRLRTFDRESGEQRADAPYPALRWPLTYMRAHGDRVYLFTDHDTRVIDRGTLEVRSVERRIEPYAVSLARDLFFEHTERRTTAFDLALGERWRGPSIERLFETSRGLLACARGSTLMFLDPTDGRERWRWSVGECTFRLRYGARSNVLVARGTSRGDVVVVRERDRLVAIAEDAPRVAQVPVTIAGRVTFRGTPLAGVRVRVGSMSALTDREGRYRASQRARGSIRVEVELDEVRRATGRPCATDMHEIVRIDGPTARTIPLRLSSRHYPRECGSSCRCDH